MDAGAGVGVWVGLNQGVVCGWNGVYAEGKLGGACFRSFALSLIAVVSWSVCRGAVLSWSSSQGRRCQAAGCKPRGAGRGAGGEGQRLCGLSGLGSGQLCQLRLRPSLIIQGLVSRQ